MRDLINLISIVEAEETDSGSDLKKNIIGLVKTTDETPVLHKVLKTLKAGNLDERIHDLLKSDADAEGFIKQITDAIINSDAPLEEKNEFLDKYPKGIVDTSLLLDGSAHTFDEIVGKGFPADLFAQLSTSLVSQGVGPGEVALAVLSPDIKWSGREAGGGDIIVDGKNIEVKTSVKSGGRWINARKANMNMPAIKAAIENATGMEVPARLGIPAWVNTYRPAIPEKTLPEVCKTIAKGLFTAVDTSAFEEVLATGDARAIQTEMLRTGYENYKKLSKFDGMLMMDVNSRTAQYFQTYDDMLGSINISSTYLYSPEGEAMPKVSLRANLGDVNSDSGLAPSVGRDKRTDTEAEFRKKAAALVLGRDVTKNTAKTKEPSSMGGVGREKRKS